MICIIQNKLTLRITCRKLKNSRYMSLYFKYFQEATIIRHYNSLKIFYFLKFEFLFSYMLHINKLSINFFKFYLGTYPFIKSQKNIYRDKKIR